MVKDKLTAVDVSDTEKGCIVQYIQLCPKMMGAWSIAVLLWSIIIKLVTQLY